MHLFAMGRERERERDRELKEKKRGEGASERLWTQRDKDILTVRMIERHKRKCSEKGRHRKRGFENY